MFAIFRISLMPPQRVMSGITKSAAQLLPQGKLYVGHSERVSDSAFDSDGQTVYKLAGARR